MSESMHSDPNGCYVTKSNVVELDAKKDVSAKKRQSCEVSRSLSLPRLCVRLSPTPLGASGPLPPLLSTPRTPLWPAPAPPPPANRFRLATKPRSGAAKLPDPSPSHGLVAASLPHRSVITLPVRSSAYSAGSAASVAALNGSEKELLWVATDQIDADSGPGAWKSDPDSPPAIIRDGWSSTMFFAHKYAGEDIVSTLGRSSSSSSNSSWCYTINSSLTSILMVENKLLLDRLIM